MYSSRSGLSRSELLDWLAASKVQDGGKSLDLESGTQLPVLVCVHLYVSTGTLASQSPAII